MSFDFGTINDIPPHRQNGGDSGSAGNARHWRLKNKRGSSLDNELSVSRSIEEVEGENNGGLNNYGTQYGTPIDYRTQSSLSENDGVGSLGGLVGTLGTSATLPAGMGNAIAAASASANVVNNFRFSTDEISQFRQEATLDGNTEQTGGGTGGRSTRATTPGDEQIFQEPVESLQIRIGRLLSCEEMCDMHFLVGGGMLVNNGSVNNSHTPSSNGQTPTTPQQRKLRIPAHRLIIASASPVFKQLLFDSATNQLIVCDEDIEITDIEPAAFLEFLRYAYTDSARLTKDNAVGVMVAARRYEITNLERQAIEYIHKCLAKKSCMAIWLSARAYGERDLERAARKSVNHFAETALLSNDFLRADQVTVCELIGDDLLRADEIIVFRALTRWAKQCCLRAGLCPTRVNVRAFIGPGLGLIRFPLMSEEQLQRMVAAEGILDDELLRALVHCSRNWPRVSSLISSAGGPLSFPNEPRTFQKLHSGRVHNVFRFASFENTLPNRYLNRSLNFLTNKRIWLSGVGLYAPRKACTFYLNVWVRVRRADHEAQTWNSPMERVEQTVFLKYDGSGHILNVVFDEPLQCEANVQYEVAACVSPTTRSTSIVRARLHPHLYYTRPSDVNFYYGTEGQYATKVRINNRQENVIFNFNWERDTGSMQEDSQSDSASNNNFFPAATASSEPATPANPPPPRPPPPTEYRRPSRMQRLRRALSFIDRREDVATRIRESGLLEGQIPLLMFYA